MTGARRGFWWAAGGAAVVGGLTVALLGGTPAEPERVLTRGAVSDPAPAPYRSRTVFPENVAPSPADEPAPSILAAFDRAPPPPPPPAQTEIPVGGPGAPAPHQTASGWIDDYRVAVCGCATRTCVGALQARFLRAIGSVDYDEQRDGSRYAEASRQAIRCYAALPVDS